MYYSNIKVNEVIRKIESFKSYLMGKQELLNEACENGDRRIGEIASLLEDTIDDLMYLPQDRAAERGKDY
jgi:uncharacterized membrane-anchored protein